MPRESATDKFARLATDLARVADRIRPEGAQPTSPYDSSALLIVYHLRAAARICREITDHAARTAANHQPEEKKK